MRLAALLRDPLTHFLAAGAALFIIASAAKPPGSGDQTIIVDRAALLAHIQYRSKAFEPGAAEALLDGLSAEARDRLIADYVREEALDREARALGLDAGDYVIRQRRVQKAEFLAEAAALTAEPTDEDINAYYKANKERYSSPPAATLTHVFLSVKERPREEARALARALLERLETDKAGFDDALRYGERFLFHRNYVDRTDDYIESQLGAAAAEAAFDPATPLGRWIGPYSSDYGEHLLFVTARTPARLAPLDDIKDLVRADLVEERRQQAIDRAIDSIVARYAVVNRLGDRR
ncbi:MAG: peptidyl-prolyl cis-trans isomerase [Parvularculaceae bacterium]